MNATLTYNEGTLLLDGLSPKEIGGLFAEGVWKWDARVGQFRTDAYRYGEVAEVLRDKLGSSFTDQIARPANLRWPKVNLHKPRRDQAEAIDAWLSSGGRGLVVMPTGSGKTEVALHLMARLGVSTLIVAPVRDLMYQWHARISAGLGVEAGIIGDRLHKPSAVTVTTYDSAAIHMSSIGDKFGLLIFDEAHHLPGGFYRDAAIMSAVTLRLGLTATPERSDGRHIDLDWLIGPEVYRRKLSEAEHLAPFETVRIPVKLTDEERERYEDASLAIRTWYIEKRKEKKDYNRKDLLTEANHDIEARRVKNLMYLKESIEDRADEKLRVLEDLFRLHPQERVLVFTGSNAMAIDISRRFLAPTILSHTMKKERQAVLSGFASGEFPMLVANQVLDEGVDVPAAKVAVVVGGQASTRQAKQRLGRILRPDGAARATLYEIVCEETREVDRSRKRRRSDAYERTRHRKV